MDQPEGVLCDDCGLVFKNLDSKRPICFKCEKREACGDDAIALEVVEVSLMHTTVSLLM